MSMDRTTETIYHFIGHFELALDELRLRTEYETFKAEEALDEDAAALELGKANVKSPFKLKDYDPEVKYTPPPNPVQGPPPPLPGMSDIGPLPFVAGPSFGGPPVSDAFPPMPFEGSLIILPFVPIPSSFVTITIQKNSLVDVDIVGWGEEDWVDPSVFYQQLMEVASLAESLSGPGSTAWAAVDALTPGYIDALRTEVQDFVIPEAEGLEAVVFIGDETVGIYVDGVLVDEAPELEDLLPEAIFVKRGLDEEEEEVTEEDGPPKEEEPDYKKNPVLDKDEKDTENPWKVDDGHKVVTGMNEATNAVSLMTATIDAGVIVVGGDVKMLSSISQVNVASDHDIGADGMDAATVAYNIAETHFYQEGYEEPDPDEPPEPDEEEEDEGGGYAGLPSVWNVEVFEGDVVTLNSFTQISFGLDTDIVEFGFSAAATYFGTGENILFNIANAVEIGFGYDLIIVGGDLIDLKMVSQTNVLLDDDDVRVQEQVNVSGADNLLYNHASISEYGYDVFEEMGDNFENALESFEDGAEELSEDVAQDELFVGIEGLRALYISGDLVQVTAISQTNVVGDQDQVALALDEFDATDASSVEVISGSNALSNIAQIEDKGFDSVIMAAGDVYDDALLYQAELIDTDAAPTGVDLMALASEAVAFLADDMLLPEVAEDVFDQLDDNMPSDTGDALQTMLA